MTFHVTEICPRCGNPRSVCSDPAVPWYPQRSVCYASASREIVWRQTRKVFKHPDPTEAKPHITDGLEWWTSPYDLTPDDDFFAEGLGVASQQGFGDDDQRHNAGQPGGD